MTSTEAAALADALAGFTSPETLGRDALLSAVDVLGEVQAVLDAVKLRVAGELVARGAVVGLENPVTRAGHTQPAGVLEERWGVGRAAARQYCVVGEAVAARQSLAGEPLPPRLPALAASLLSGGVSVDQAGVIVRELVKAAPGCSPADLALGERVLVEQAHGLTVTELRVLAGHVRDRLDADGIEPREERQRRCRSLTISTTEDGMTHVDWYLDPESAGYVVTAIDAHVAAQLRAVRFQEVCAEPELAVPEDTRTIAQLRSDAATEVFRHVAACTAPAEAGKPPVTVVVRIDWEALRSGVGTGEIDGVRSPVSAGTVRRMAADANLIPVVLGDDSQVLDLGRARRLFTTAQRIALAERDGGCAWPACPHPPAYTEAHHLRWWTKDGGSTDLNNGILLCSSHHHRIHDDGWDIQVRDNVPSFIPPSHIDPHRRPRRGGRVQLPENTRAA
ncbi:DUF222 domain-containing protein [Leifsonia sp. NPDC080035]|uniref:DUF222 domain-containing protein n=1 Tax=Leifsonia sp. NPDC080035 TaxID=3143936 RepID=A0AAU7GJ44_9MICO